MKYTYSSAFGHTPNTTRHDWFNAWLKHDHGVERFKQFILDCFETCPDIPEEQRNLSAEENALEIIDDVYCGKFKRLKQYPKYNIPTPPKYFDDSEPWRDN